MPLRTFGLPVESKFILFPFRFDGWSVARLEEMATIGWIVDRSGGLFWAIHPIQRHGKGFGKDVQNPLMGWMYSLTWEPLQNPIQFLCGEYMGHRLRPLNVIFKHGMECSRTTVVVNHCTE
jgi:hypothetical protein